LSGGAGVVAGSAAGALAPAAFDFLLLFVLVAEAELSLLPSVLLAAAALSAAAFSFFAFFFAALELVSGAVSFAGACVARAGAKANTKLKTAIHKVSLYLL
jgi:hypothetical protein